MSSRVNSSFLRRGALLAVLILLQPNCGGRFPGGSNPGDTGRRGAARPAPHFEPGFNLFSEQQDIELGQQSAQQLARQIPLLGDEATVNYVRQLGARLAARAPGYKFPYQFNVAAVRDINAFALPGGFIFVNAGTIAAAKNEGELAGVLAHEIMHVALRHGTNQASKAYIARAGLGVLTGIVGDSPDLAQVINVIGGAGANAIFLKFGRTAERQSDLEGARIMAEAGYDPRDMAAFFKTIEAQGGQRGVPEFLSDHPDPGNRIASINEALPSLPVRPNPTRTTSEFERVKARLSGARRSGALASSEERVERKGPSDPNDMEPGARPESPSTSLTEFQAPDGSFAFRYPQNWNVLSSDQANLVVAPKGAYGQIGQSIVVTHGMFVGATEAQARDLQSATAAFVRQQINVNPDFRIVRAPQPVSFGGRQGYATVVSGPSPVTSVTEYDVIYTTATADGRLFYLIAIAPEDELDAYRGTFEQIISSLRLAG